MKVGDKLPSERHFAEQLGVGRGAVREALRSLGEAGIIRIVKGAHGGAFVTATDAARIVQAVSDYVHMGSVTLGEITEARIALQDVIVRLAIKRATEADLDELERVAAMTTLTDDVETRFTNAVAFYAVLARASGNRLFEVLVHSLANVFHDFVRGPGYATLQESLIESRFRLVAFMRARDANAAAAEIREHLLRVDAHVRSHAKGANASRF